MEIDKELRLPAGVKSWWDLLRNVPSQDGLPLHNRSDNMKFFLNGAFHVEDIHVDEIFEGDVVTIKARGFDELKEIIPGKEVLYKIHSKLRANSYFEEMNEELQFIEKLINLT